MRARTAAATVFAVWATVAVAAAVASLVPPMLRWGRPDATSMLAVGLGMGLAVVRWPRARGEVDSGWGPAGLVFASLIGFAMLRFWAQTPLGGAIAAGLAGLGAAGLWLPARTWRALWGPTFIIIAALPIGRRADEWLGLPARLVAVDWAHLALTRVGVPVDSASTVLVFENGLTDVAPACAGLRGMWTLFVLLLFVVVLERRRVSIRFGAVLIASMAGLLLGNVARIVALLLIARALAWPEAAAAVHEALGLTVFAAVAAAGVMGVRSWAEIDPRPETESPVQRSSSPRRRSLPYALTAVAASVAAGIAFAGQGAPTAPVRVILPPGLATTKVPLLPAEAALVRSFAGGGIDKLRFEHDGASGELILVQARVWRQQHPPELCLTVGGHALTGARDVSLGPRHRVRVLDLEGERRAVYWYQNVRGASPDLWARVWASWTRPDEAWVLVSFLFSSQGPALPETTLAAVYGAVHRALAQPATDEPWASRTP